MSGELVYRRGDGRLAFRRGDGHLIYRGDRSTVTLTVTATFSPTHNDEPDQFAELLHGAWVGDYDGKGLTHVSTSAAKDAQGYVYAYSIEARAAHGRSFRVRWRTFYAGNLADGASVEVALSLNGRRAGGFSAESTEAEQERWFTVSADGSSITEGKTP